MKKIALSLLALVVTTTTATTGFAQDKLLNQYFAQEHALGMRQALLEVKMDAFNEYRDTKGLGDVIYPVGTGATIGAVAAVLLAAERPVDGETITLARRSGLVAAVSIFTAAVVSYLDSDGRPVYKEKYVTGTLRKMGGDATRLNAERDRLGQEQKDIEAEQADIANKIKAAQDQERAQDVQVDHQ